jgi:Protein of unknown function (DUF3306)
MSDDNFLERWSRRKREAAQRRNQPAKPDETASERTSDVAIKEGAPPAPKAQDAEMSFDPASLPSIDSINALSDVRAFLAPGVPAGLTRAALRRAWAADPAIRDFVGLSENSWDFTTPGSIPGFEAIGGSEELRRLVAHLTEGGAPIEPEETDGPVAEPEEVTETSQIEHATVSSGLGESGDEQLSPEPESVLLQHNKDDAASRYEGTEDEPGGAAARRGHGGALPK